MTTVAGVRAGTALPTRPPPITLNDGDTYVTLGTQKLALSCPGRSDSIELTHRTARS